MRRFVEALDVDYDQWRALTRALLRIDFRTTRIHRGATASNSDDRQAGRVIGQAIFYLLMGVVAAAFVMIIDDPVVSATFVLTYVMTMIGLMVLVDHHSVITSPDDFAVLGARPVSSRTYFAVRLTNVLVFSLALTTAFGALPMLAYGFAHGFRPQLWLAAIPAFYLAAIFTALLLVVSYAWLLRVAGPRRLSRVLSYAQLVIGFVVYGVYLLPGAIARNAGHLTLPDSPWLLLFPPTWFASYFAIANGTIVFRQGLAATASVLAIALLARGLGSRLSFEYAEQLGALMVAPGSKRAAMSRRRPWFFRTGESRVVSLLVLAQFRNDQKFRMGVMAVIPMTLVYMFLSFRDGIPPDPLSGRMSVQGWNMISLAVLFFPVMVRLNLTRSDAWRASWIYFGTPVSRARILRAQTQVVMTFFLAPYLLSVIAVMGWFVGSVTGVAVHVLFLGLLSLLSLQVVTLILPDLPFSQPPQKLARNGALTFWTMAMVAVASLLGPIFSVVVYRSATRIGLAAGTLVLASLVLDRLTRVRIGETAEHLEFES